MSNPFFDHPILNSPYACPQRHWELDESGQPTQKTIETRRRAEFITPIPKPKKRKGAALNEELGLDDGTGLSTKDQNYDLTSRINEIRGDVTDGKADHITREPEQVKAFRDTWRDGIHSYLTYLRDRLTVACEPCLAVLA